MRELDLLVADAHSAAQKAQPYAPPRTPPTAENVDATAAAWKTQEVAHVPRPFRLLVTGSRTWSDLATMRQHLHEIYLAHRTNATLVHGGAAGADRMATHLAKKAGWQVEEHPVQWETHGKAAGPLRNTRMVNTGADLCLAFTEGASRWASHCAKTARKAGIPTREIQPRP